MEPNFSMLLLFLAILSHYSMRTTVHAASVKDISEDNYRRDHSSGVFSNLDFKVESDRRSTNPARFLGDTPLAVFINVISVLGTFFTIWSWAETRDDQKKSKDEPDINDLVDEIHDYQNYVKFAIDDMKDIQKQLVCRFDAVYSKSKIISTDCLPYIKPYQPPVNKASPPPKPYSHHQKPINRVDKKDYTSPSIYYGNWKGIDASSNEVF